MQRSSPRATDDQVRELVRQLADAAPMAPTWDRMSTSVQATPGPPPDGRRKLVLAAVAIVSVLLAVAWLRPDPPDTPADRPADTADPADVQRASTVPPVRSPFEVGGLPPIDAQWCSARHNLVAARGHIDDLSRRSEELAGLSDLRSRMSVYGIATGPLAALSQQAELDADLRAMVAAAVEAFGAADDQNYAGDGGAEGAGLAAALSTWERAADALIADTSSSWVGCEPSLAGEAGLAAVRGAVRCASIVALDDGLRRIADDVPDESDDVLVAAVAGSVGGWFEGEVGSPSVVAERVVLALTGPSDDRATELAVLRDEVALVVADPDGPCADRTSSQLSSSRQPVHDREAES